MNVGKQVKWDCIKYRSLVLFSNGIGEMCPAYASVIHVPLKLMWEIIQVFFPGLVYSLIRVAQCSL